MNLGHRRDAAWLRERHADTKRLWHARPYVDVPVARCVEGLAQVQTVRVVMVEARQSGESRIRQLRTERKSSHVCALFCYGLLRHSCDTHASAAVRVSFHKDVKTALQVLRRHLVRLKELVAL